MNFSAVKFLLAALLALSMVASNSAAFGVSGAVFIEDVSPGQELVHKITVSTRDHEPPLNMTAEVFGFGRSASGSNIEIRAEDDTGPYSARPFLSVEPTSFSLEPGDRETLLLTGTVPEDVGSGGRYAIVNIKTAPKAAEGSGVTILTAIQVHVLLTIKGSELIKTGEISDLTASMNEGNVSVDLLFDNTGNIHYKPLIGAALLNEAGYVVAEQEPMAEMDSILPTGSRLVSMTLVPDAMLEPGTYTVMAEVALDDGTVLDTAETTVEV